MKQTEVRKLQREQRSQQTGIGRGHRQGSYSFCCMLGLNFATRCRKVGSMQKYSFETWQKKTLRHDVARQILKHTKKFTTRCRKVDFVRRRYEAYPEEKVCDIVSQSQKGEIMVFTIKAVGQEHILQPIRAEPMIGENSPLHKENNTTIKKKG